MLYNRGSSFISIIGMIANLERTWRTLLKTRLTLCLLGIFKHLLSSSDFFQYMYLFLKKMQKHFQSYHQSVK